MCPVKAVNRAGIPAQEWISQPGIGEFYFHPAQGFAEGPVDHGALVSSQRPYAVAGAKEREILLHDPVQQSCQLPLHPVLDRRFCGRWDRWR